MRAIDASKNGGPAPPWRPSNPLISPENIWRRQGNAAAAFACPYFHECQQAEGRPGVAASRGVPLQPDPKRYARPLSRPAPQVAENDGARLRDHARPPLRMVAM